ncbi:MAG: hypothetical protein ACRECY_12720 [Phyllobacterium sp.]
MSARLLSWPVGLNCVSMEPLSGPRSIGGGGSQSIGNFAQTFSSPFGMWRWQFSFPPMEGDLFRRYRGWITGLNGGSNATRVPFFDPDMMSFQAAGVLASRELLRSGMPWANGMPWDVPGRDPWFNTGNWAIDRPNVPVSAARGKDATIISLQNVYWGRKLDVGDYLGFFPFHFGLYMVTEVMSDDAYRIWPPLRKAIAVGDYATLYPTLAMRLESEDAAKAGRGLENADGLVVTLVEAFDYDVRDYFTD